MSQSNHLIFKTTSGSSIVSNKATNQMENIVLTNALAKTECTVYFHGGHIASFKVDDHEMLFMSDKCVFDNEKPLRGGIPIVFPQFGPGPLPQHGFARNSKWKLVEFYVSDVQSEVSIVLRLTNQDIEKDLSWKNISFALDYKIVLTSDKHLMTRFTVHNKEDLKDGKPFCFTTALHTYFAISHIHHVKIEGLKNLKYIDKLLDQKISTEDADYLHITKETDRIYLQTPAFIKVYDQDKVIVIDRSENNNNFCDTVVWNPWIAKSKKMEDFGDEEYNHMVCLESARIQNNVELNPGSSWEASQHLYFQKKMNL